jgi:outer membrane protein TolC
MLKKIIILLFLPVLLQAQKIDRIGQLFDSLKTHPASIGDEIQVKQALAGETMAYSKLYPNIDIFGRYDYASIATGMVPVPPNDLLAMVKKTSVAQPFSDQIYRVGVTISMPIFMASIFPMATKAKMMVSAAKDQMNINLLRNEAIIVSANANLLYMQALDSALTKKKNSLLKTKEFVLIKVNNGRAPESALIYINNGINQIDILKNDLALQREGAIEIIKSLTGVTLTTPIIMEQIGTFKDGDLKVLDPLRKKVEADRQVYRAEKEKLLPALMLQGSYSNNFAKSYNNDKNVNNDYTFIGVVLKVPLFAKDQYAQIKKSRLDFEASSNELNKMKLEFAAQASQLQNNLLFLDNSIELYKNSIKEKEELRNISQVSYKNDQMSLDDYLKYEDDLVLEQSKLFKSQAQKWETLMKLNVIYGNKIEEIIK